MASELRAVVQAGPAWRPQRAASPTDAPPVDKVILHEPAAPATVLHPQRNLDRDPIRVYGRPFQPIDVETLHGQAIAAPGRVIGVSNRTLERKLQNMDTARQDTLLAFDEGGAQSNARVLTEDGSVYPDYYYMRYTDGGDIDLGFIENMSRIGRIEGFGVAVQSTDGGKSTIQSMGNTRIVPGQPADVWTEYGGEMHSDGTTSVPAHVEDVNLISDAVLRGRIERLYPYFEYDPNLSGEALQALVAEKFPLANYRSQGRVNERRTQIDAAAYSLGTGRAARSNMSYVEGGNLIPGTLADGGGYALVGKDSLAITQSLLTRSLNRLITADEARAAIAQDLGIRPEHVFDIEQPGCFHIDMRMCLVGPREVILNDSKLAACMQEIWMRDDYAAQEPLLNSNSFIGRLKYSLQLRQWEKQKVALEASITQLHRMAAVQAMYEDMAVQDLKRHGMTVHRLAGVFVDPQSGHDVMNLLNSEQGTNPLGQRFYITLGGDARAEEYVAKSLLQVIPTSIHRVYFLDRKLTRPTLELFGGINCRAKPDGALASA